MRRSVVVLVWLLGGCGGSADDTSTDTPPAETDTPTDSDTEEPLVCGEIPPNVCDEETACRSIKGFPIVDDGDGAYCVDDDGLPRRIGCISKDVDCDGGAARWARPPGAEDDVCFRVLGSCVPRDYVPCAPALEVEDSCATP